MPRRTTLCGAAWWKCKAAMSPCASAGWNEVFVKEGDTLVQGDSIGVAGEVPAEAAAGAHLHVECMQGGQYIDPAKLVGRGPGGRKRP